MPSEITAERLYEMVSQWPQKTRPSGVEIVGRLWHVDTLPIHLAHAIAIHEAAKGEPK